MQEKLVSEMCMRACLCMCVCVFVRVCVCLSTHPVDLGHISVSTGHCCCTIYASDDSPVDSQQYNKCVL